MEKSCPNCKVFFQTEKTNKIFCSMTCRTRFNAKLRYTRLKDDPQYKRKSKEYFKVWLEKNRAHFNELVREPNRLYQQKKRQELMAKGLCLRCGRNKPDEGYVNCNNCKQQFNLWYKQWKERKKQETKII
ncbi:MAG: hypothetical protein QXO70_01885 [Candidatus Pacearchaeota archaeon]